MAMASRESGYGPEGEPRVLREMAERSQPTAVDQMLNANVRGWAKKLGSTDPAAGTQQSPEQPSPDDWEEGNDFDPSRHYGSQQQP